MKETRHIALCGNPNCGKTTLFNLITGWNQKTSNLSGTTVDRKTALIKIHQENVRITDTPGTYSAQYTSEDEKIAFEFLDFGHPERPDGIVYVADAANLKRHLYYFTQLAALKLPMILVLNMEDVAKKQKIHIDRERLEKELGIPVLLTSGRKKSGIPELKAAFKDRLSYMVHRTFSSDPAKAYKEIEGLLEKVIRKEPEGVQTTEKIDRVMTHPFWGYFILLFILLLMFQSVFSLAEWPMTWIEEGMGWLSESTSKLLGEGWVKDLVVDGVLAGITGVVVFIPQIALLFFFMSILEDSGYMSRVSFMMDGLLKRMGMSGQSVIPLVGGAACAIPAIMASRSIKSPKERLITMLVTPLMSCSARIPVYSLFIALLVPEKKYLFLFDVRALLLLLMYLLGIVSALGTAYVIQWFIKEKGQSVYAMELPRYHIPHWRNVVQNVWSNCANFVWSAGRIIFLISIILWVLQTRGPSENGYFEQTDNLEESYLGAMGKSIEPVVKPLGYDWKIGISLIASVAAREVFVGTMYTLYALEESDSPSLLVDKLRNAKDPESGQPIYTFAVICSLLVFYAFALQCTSTIVVMYKETRSIKWPAVQFMLFTGLAYVSSLLIFQILS
jgi:ferrous iron transport protein B